MNFDSKFKIVCEETVMRYQQGGILEGDYIRLVKNYRKNPKISGKGRDFLQRLEYYETSTLPLKVTCVKADRSEVSNGVVGAVDAPTGHWADIIIEYAPGLWNNVITVPLEIIERVETGNNFSPGIHPSTIRPNTTQIKPHEVTQADNNKNLPKTNTKLAYT